MKQSETPQKRKKNGIPTWKIVLPITLVLIVLHALIIGAILSINKASSGLNELMASYSDYISDVTDLQAGASFLSETAASFTLHPRQEESGEPNIALYQRTA